MTMPINADSCPEKPLSPSQLRAIDALLCSKTKQEAAQRAEVSVRTLSGYLNQPEFIAALTEAQGHLIKDASHRLKTAANPARDTLLRICQDEAAPKSVQVSAARALLEYNLKYSEFNDVLSELRRLEGEYL